MYNKNVHKVSFSVHDSHVWHDLLKVKNFHQLGRQVITKSSDKTRFWEDSWLENQPLCHIFLNLFDICDYKDIMVKKVLEVNTQLSFEIASRGYAKEIRKYMYES
jgi:hypothetical protein